VLVEGLPSKGRWTWTKVHVTNVVRTQFLRGLKQQTTWTTPHRNLPPGLAVNSKTLQLCVIGAANYK
jgi:hypothetical protein